MWTHTHTHGATETFTHTHTQALAHRNLTLRCLSRTEHFYRQKTCAHSRLHTHTQVPLHTGSTEAPTRTRTHTHTGAFTEAYSHKYVHVQVPSLADAFIQRNFTYILLRTRVSSHADAFTQRSFYVQTCFCAQVRFHTEGFDAQGPLPLHAQMFVHRKLLHTELFPHESFYAKFCH